MMHRRRFLVALLIVALIPQMACRSTPPAPSVGTLVLREGTATLTVDGKPQIVKVGDRVPVPFGALVKTDKDGKGKVVWGPQIHGLEPDSELRFDAPSADGPEAGVGHVELLRGAATFLLPKAEGDKYSKFQAGCGTIIAAVRGTEFTLALSGSDVKLDVYRGKVALFNRGGGGGRAGPLDPSRPAPPSEGEPIKVVTPEARAIVTNAAPGERSSAPGAGAVPGEPDANGVVTIPVSEGDLKAKRFILDVLRENIKMLPTF